MAEPERLLLNPDAEMPNSRLPVLLYRAAITQDKSGVAQGIMELFATNNWRGAWRNGIYPFHHYHSTSHEVLGIESGTVTVLLGGDSGTTVDLVAGDIVVLPAGTGHMRLSSNPGLSVIGAYPRGQEGPDLLRARSAEAEARIAHLALPKIDPVMGPDGPLLKLWTGSPHSR
jgi:uncharacterized protein YjlB